MRDVLYFFCLAWKLEQSCIIPIAWQDHDKAAMLVAKIFDLSKDFMVTSMIQSGLVDFFFGL